MSSKLEDPPTLTPQPADTDPAPPPPPPVLVLKPGDEIGNYVIEAKIGQGGMGAVYKAKHKELGRIAAIKLMLDVHKADANLTARFQNEAKLSNRVQHPGIVQVFETGRLPTGELFMIMEWINGQTLHSHLRAAAATHPQGMSFGGLAILRQIAGIMAFAHEQDVIHRDLKPQNIILVDDPEARDLFRVKILDFGIAKFAARSTPAPSHLDPVHTHTGAQLGSPPYMSPELWTGSKTMDDRVDCYALGVIAYQVLANSSPFPTTDPRTPAEIVHRFEAPKPLKSLNPSLPAELCQLVESLLFKEPGDRPSMAGFRDEASKIMGLKPGPTTRSIPTVSAPTPKATDGAVSINADYSHHSDVSETVDGGAAAPKIASPGSVGNPLAIHHADDVPGPRPKRKLTVGILAASLALLVVLVGVSAYVNRTKPTSISATQPSPTHSVAVPLEIPDMTRAEVRDSAEPSLSPTAGTSLPAQAHALAKEPKAKVSCVFASDACISSSATAGPRKAILAALQEKPIKLCEGDRLVLVGKPSISIRTSRGIEYSTKQHLFYALQGSFGKMTFDGEIEIRCKK